MKKQILDRDYWMLLNRIVFRNLKVMNDEEFLEEIEKLVDQHKAKDFKYPFFARINREDIGKVILILDRLLIKDYELFLDLVEERIKWNRKDINEA